MSGKLWGRPMNSGAQGAGPTGRPPTEDFATLRREMREIEFRLAAAIEMASNSLRNRMLGLILGSLVVNVFALLAAVFTLAKMSAR